MSDRRFTVEFSFKFEGSVSARKKEVHKNSVVIGTGRKADLDIDEPLANQRHALLEVVSPDEMYIRSLDGIENVTILGDAPVPVSERTRLEKGSAVRIGETLVEVVAIKPRKNRAGVFLGIGIVGLFLFGPFTFMAISDEEDRQILLEKGVAVPGNVVSTRVRERRVRNEETRRSETEYTYFITIRYTYPANRPVRIERRVQRSMYNQFKDASLSSPIPVDLVIDPEDSERWLFKDELHRSNRGLIIFFGSVASIMFMFIVVSTIVLLKNRGKA